MSAAMTHDVFKIPNAFERVAEYARRSFPLRLDRGEG